MAEIVSLSHVLIHFFIPVKKEGKFWDFPDVVGGMWGMHSGIEPTHNAEVLREGLLE